MDARCSSPTISASARSPVCPWRCSTTSSLHLIKDVVPERFRNVLYLEVGHTVTPEMRAEMLVWFARWLVA
jgi:hypothetical protein